MKLFESLEGRRLLSGAVLSSAGALLVSGDADAANHIAVALSADGTKVNVVVDSAKPNLPIKHWQGAFDKAKVTSIGIRGGEYADDIAVGQIGPKFSIKTRIDSLAGADLIRTGAEEDVIYAGAGNDKVFAGDGNDKVAGGLGNDEIHGQGGNDALAGNEGNDKLFGDAGDDTLYGILGVNGLFGGPGKDTFVVKSLAGQPNDFTIGTDVLKIVPGPTGDLS